MTLRRKILLIAVGLAVMVFAAVGAGWRQLSTDSSPVSVQKAVGQFQQAGKGNASGPPRPGVYTYAVQGKECAGVVGLHLCRSFPSQARMIVTRKPGTITVEVDLSQDHLEASRFDVHSDGRYLAWQRTRIVFGIAQENVTATTPATLALPSALHVGQRWTQRFSAGGLPVVTTNQVTKQAAMKIDGASVEAYEIDASSTTGGDHPGTETDVTWHDSASGLDVRLIVHRRIGGTFPYTMDVDATLQSLTPIG
jgi:hypothetical protein